jgi:hypothetical protein
MLKLSSKIYLAIFATTLIILGIWSFFIFKNRNSLPAENPSQIKQTQTEETQTADNEEPSGEEESNNETVSNQEENVDEEPAENENDEVEKTNLYEVSSKDCNNDCEDFKKKEELKYCRQFCGIKSEDNEENGDDCGKLSGLEKDYCLKDLAIKEKDLEKCEEIEDSGILKACRNRITEDLLDSSQEKEL